VLNGLHSEDSFARGEYRPGGELCYDATAGMQAWVYNRQVTPDSPDYECDIPSGDWLQHCRPHAM
jgi:hypothetical protein